MTFRIYKITPFPDRPWNIRDEAGLIDEEIDPNEVVIPDPIHVRPDLRVKDVVGARPCIYYKAEKRVDGWTFKRRVRGVYW